MIYWLTETAASSARLYWESFRSIPTDAVLIPAGCSIFPKEIFRGSRRWVEQRYTKLVYFNELDKGGHFAAFEQPEMFVHEVRMLSADQASSEIELFWLPSVYTRRNLGNLNTQQI